jgi:hypothetical protein
MCLNYQDFVRLKRLAKIHIPHERRFKLEVKSLHEIKVSLQVKIEIQEDKKVIVGNIATSRY